MKIWKNISFALVVISLGLFSVIVYLLRRTESKPPFVIVSSEADAKITNTETGQANPHVQLKPDKTATAKLTSEACPETRVYASPTEREMLFLNGLKWGPIEEDMQWDTASSFCRKRGLRLPTAEELVQAFESNNKNILACTRDCHFWSGDVYAEFKDYAHYVSLSKGAIEKDLKSYLKAFRCVK